MVHHRRNRIDVGRMGWIRILAMGKSGHGIRGHRHVDTLAQSIGVHHRIFVWTFVLASPYLQLNE